MAELRRILCGLKPQWERSFRASADPGQFTIVMADLKRAATAGYDAVVPIDLTDHRWLETFGQHLPALPVPKAVRQLCNDKLALNLRLIALGFGDHIPALRDRLPDDPTRQPVIVKPRQGAWGKGSDLVLNAAVPDHIAANLAAGTHFIQDFTPGRQEYATHVLIHRGVPQLWQTIAYDMGPDPGIKGATHKARQSKWLSETPGQDILRAMLNAIGFDQGTCCIDYRMVENRLMLFEINPRFGGSLSWNVTPYLQRYLACVDLDRAP